MQVCHFFRIFGASQTDGLCCRKLGILKWPFRDRNVTAKNIISDTKSCADSEAASNQSEAGDDCCSSVSTSSSSASRSVAGTLVSGSAPEISSTEEPSSALEAGDGFAGLSSELDFFTSETTEILAAAAGGCRSCSEDEADGGRGGSGCDAAPHVDDGDVILSDSTTDVSDSEAPPFLQPAGGWDVRICPDSPKRSTAADKYRRMLREAGAAERWGTGRWWLGGGRGRAGSPAHEDDGGENGTVRSSPAPRFIVMDSRFVCAATQQRRECRD